jgi:hypothetical protein
MNARRFLFRIIMLISLAVASGVPFARPADAHCDTLDGPVVADARLALERGDPTPILKWIAPADEPEIRAAFARTLAVRAQGTEARELADMYLFETLVRVHRASEGAPYTGLKPAGAELPAAVTGADDALASGSVDGLVKLLTSEIEEGVRHRFMVAHEARQHANDSVAAGRAFVAAYVEFVHYVERRSLAATSAAHTTEHEEAHGDLHETDQGAVHEAAHGKASCGHDE